MNMIETTTAPPVNSPVRQQRIAEPAEPKKPRRPRSVEDFLKAFARGELAPGAAIGNYSVQRRRGCEWLIYTEYSRGRSWQPPKGTAIGADDLAVRVPSGTVFSNGSRLLHNVGLRRVGRRCSVVLHSPTPAQITLERAGAIPVPINVFRAAMLDITRAKVIDKEPARIVRVLLHVFPSAFEDRSGTRVYDRRHFCGACVLEVDGGFHLFDIDRLDIKRGVFNPFLVRLNRAARTIEGAYLSLRPKEAVLAELEDPRSVRRQGEWFFIKHSSRLPPLPKPPKNLEKVAQTRPDLGDYGGRVRGNMYDTSTLKGLRFRTRSGRLAFKAAASRQERARRLLPRFFPQPGDLRNGDHNPHQVQRHAIFNGKVLVSGKVSHREHPQLLLRGWWRAVPNLAVRSWRVTSGSVD